MNTTTQRPRTGQRAIAFVRKYFTTGHLLTVLAGLCFWWSLVLLYHAWHYTKETPVAFTNAIVAWLILLAASSVLSIGSLVARRHRLYLAFGASWCFVLLAQVANLVSGSSSPFQQEHVTWLVFGQIPSDFSGFLGLAILLTVATISRFVPGNRNDTT